MFERNTPTAKIAAEAGMLMVAEISHRVVNEYTAAICGLRVAASSIDDERARNAIERAASRLTRSAEAHRALCMPRQSPTFQASAYLEKVCDAVLATWPQDQEIDMTFIDREVVLDAGLSWRLGLIVAELIANCCRHAFVKSGGRIVVDLRTTQDHVQCEVADNGWGGPSSADGLGTRIVDGIAAELAGMVSRRATPGGRTVTVTIPMTTLYA
jgi:two-component sensor histidine kinase